MTQTLTMNDTFKVGDKVFCKDVFEEFTGWIANIYDNVTYPYIVVENREDIGKSYRQLRYESKCALHVFKLEDLTLLQDDNANIAI